MEVIKRKSGYRYREMIFFNGKTLKSPCFKRKTDAKEWKKKKTFEVERMKLLGEDFSKEDISLKEFSDKWLQEVVAIKCSVSTHDNYSSNFKNHINPLLGDLKLRSLDISHAHKLAGSLKVKGNNAKGMNNIIGALKTMLNEAVRQGYIPRNPFAYFSNFQPDIQDERFFSKEELEKFLKANREDELFSYYFTAFHTGMRKGEIAALKWDRIDFDKNLIYVSRTIDKYGFRETTKSGKSRIVPIHPDLFKLLKRLQKEARLKKTEFVFSTSEGKPLVVTHIYRSFRKAQQKAGIKNFMKFHGTRHTFASHYMMNGGSIFDLQKILGHSDIKMTMRYSHYSPEHLQSSISFMLSVPDVFKDDFPDSNHILKLAD